MTDKINILHKAKNSPNIAHAIDAMLWNSLKDSKLDVISGDYQVLHESLPNDMATLIESIRGKIEGNMGTFFD